MEYLLKLNYGLLIDNNYKNLIFIYAAANANLRLAPSSEYNVHITSDEIDLELGSSCSIIKHPVSSTTGKLINFIKKSK
jgi:hypothetical protein